MRIGIFGGTFDPIHLGHLVLAEQCREQCRLDEVWFVPAALPPHKLDATISSAKARSEMIEFAIAGNPAFKLSNIELDRTGPSYTVTTLEELTASDPSRELFLLIGADSVRDLPTWREPKRILELATVVAVNRGRAAMAQAETVQILTEQLGCDASGRIQFVEMPGIDTSATDIRNRVAKGLSVRYLVPRAVEMYLRENSLYRRSES
ncbi:MAG: nadD [Schlesneria sp.]|nr:nadD [Schlesneria sp.]